MNSPPLRGIVRAYIMSIAFWCGFALLMGLQYRPLNRQHLWSWLLDLLVEVALRGLALAFWTPPIFFWSGSISVSPIVVFVMCCSGALERCPLCYFTQAYSGCWFLPTMTRFISTCLALFNPGSR